MRSSPSKRPAGLALFLGSSPFCGLFALASCGGPAVQASASAPEGTVAVVRAPPVSSSTAPKANIPAIWIKDARTGLEDQTGVLQSARLSDGTVVAALSYMAEGDPFLFYHGAPGNLTRSVAPWKCEAGPAEIEVSGSDVWVHCIDPANAQTSPRVHFWHGADGGKTWSRAGALDGMIALGAFGVAGGRLFVAGSFEKKRAVLQVVERDAAGKWGTRAAQGVDAWPADAVIHLGVSADGSNVAILGQIESKTPKELVFVASTDGGRTLAERWTVP